MDPETEIACACARVAVGRESVRHLIAVMDRVLFDELVPKVAKGESNLEFQDLMVNLYSQLSDRGDDLAAVQSVFKDVTNIPEIVERCPLETILFEVDQAVANDKLDSEIARHLVTMRWNAAANLATSTSL